MLDSVETSSFVPAFQEKMGGESGEVSVPFGPVTLEVGNDDIKYSGPKLKEPESYENHANLHRISKSVEPSTIPLKTSPNPVRKVVSPSSLDKTTWTQEVTTVRNVTPQTHPRSPSPEIYREDPSGNFDNSAFLKILTIWLKLSTSPHTPHALFRQHVGINKF